MLKFLLIPDDEIFIFIQLGFEFGFTVDDLVFLIVSHLISFNNKVFHFTGSVVDDLLKFIDLSVE